MCTDDTEDQRAADLLSAFRKARQRTEWIFALVREEAYHDRPIPLRHPIVFYDGHLDAFIYNTLFQQVLGRPALHETFDDLFRRGIDPAHASGAPSIEKWPTRSEIRAYKAEVTALLYQALSTPGFLRQHDFLHGGKLLYLLLEHELMHQETLLYLLHQLPYERKQAPQGSGGGPGEAQGARVRHKVEVPPGIAVLGTWEGEFDYGWDNEFPQARGSVPGFRIDAFPVDNGHFLEFIEAGGYRRPEFWEDAAWRWRCEHDVQHPFFWVPRGKTFALRGLFAEGPLLHDTPVYVTHAEACAYARFTSQSLPTEAQWHRAAYGDHPEWPYPWGHEPPTPERGNFDFASLAPAKVGSFPAGQSSHGVHDLCGNGWEWTRTVFQPFPGFVPHPAYPGYSADFFDGQHHVLKGGSWATDARLLRRPFRNWFYGHYPYVYATFRCTDRPATGR